MDTPEASYHDMTSFVRPLSTVAALAALAAEWSAIRGSRETFESGALQYHDWARLDPESLITSHRGLRIRVALKRIATAIRSKTVVALSVGAQWQATASKSTLTCLHPASFSAGASKTGSTSITRSGIAHAYE